jgi:hypothetical protein
MSGRTVVTRAYNPDRARMRAGMCGPCLKREVATDLQPTEVVA